MRRKEFLKKIGLGTLGSTATLVALSSCGKDDGGQMVLDPEACVVSPSETAGPFPLKTPAEVIRENIVGDRAGIPLVIKIKVENINNNCAAMVGVSVDIWQCDSKGNYSEYGGQLDGDFTSQNFLRGRQDTDQNGIASFVSIYPGWYPGRAPHLHLEVKDSDGKSLLVTQTAFPEEISKAVYATEQYKGDFDTSNSSDFEFENSLNQNLAESVSGNTTDGYVLNETIKVSA